MADLRLGRHDPSDAPPAAYWPLVDLLSDVGAQTNATPAQIILACLLAQKPWIVPIPGTTKLEHLEENLGAVRVVLSSDDLQRIESAYSKITVHGARTTPALMERSDDMT